MAQTRTNNSNKKTNYNKTLVALWSTNNENHLSMRLDARSFDQIQSVLAEIEVGGKFIVKKLSEDARAKFKNPDKAPHYFLEYITKASADDYEAKNSRNRGRGDEGL